MKKQLAINEKKISNLEKNIEPLFDSEREKYMKKNLLYRMIMLFD